MNIDNITSGDMTLTNNGKAMQIKVYEERIKQLQSNWNSLREWYQKKYDETKNNPEFYDEWFVCKCVLDKMNELEGREDE